jgi:dUTP pyrophosphatase
MQVKIKKLVPEAVIPTRARPGDAGLDLTATSVTVTPDYMEFGTGLAIEIPVGKVGLMFARSSISKMAHSIANSVGVIDAPFRGEIKVRMRWKKTQDNLGYTMPDGQVYKVGHKVAQLVIVDCWQGELTEVDTLSETSRGSGGFGSTGT